MLPHALDALLTLAAFAQLDHQSDNHTRTFCNIP